MFLVGHAYLLYISTSKGCSARCSPFGGQNIQHLPREKQIAHQTLLILKDSAPCTSETWICAWVTNLSTFFREWTALHSIKSHKLMPLTPYILKAAPVVSAAQLR